VSAATRRPNASGIDSKGVREDERVLPLRLALAQCRLVVGDLSGNADVVRHHAARAHARGAQLVAFPEMTITGYPPEDLVFRRSFCAASEAAVGDLATTLVGDGLGELPVVVGFLRRDAAGRPHNSAAVLFGGSVAAVTDKVLLPTYGVFDERRYFEPGSRFVAVTVGGVRIGLSICEDLWWPGGPAAAAAEAGVDLLLCINGSPYESGKAEVREALIAERAAEAGAPVAYLNQVGGQDELVFDGGSFVLSEEGEVILRADQFTEELVVADLALPAHVATTATESVGLAIERVVLSEDPIPQGEPLTATIAARRDRLDLDYAAVVTGTRDYVRKNGFRSVVVALSGGIDSALTTTIAVDAIGADNVHTVAMPSSYSSAHSLDDAEDLATRQGTQHRVIPIKPMVEAYQDSLHLTGLAEENLQARVRGTLLMALSNSEGHLALTTGNKSELATGFSTLYGDSAGGFAPIKDIVKSDVWALSRWRNEQSPDAPPIPEQSITKPPSAELAPGQLDTDRLPDYAVLDRLVDDYVENDLGRAELVAEGFDTETVDRVVRLVDLAEYKRRQNPPGPKVTPKAFGRDRRLPITNRWREGG
jgi:NAD+ synthase (glutamine-hydrolysing)